MDKKTKGLTIKGKVLAIILGIVLIISAVSIGISFSVYSNEMNSKFNAMALDFTDTAIVCLADMDMESICADTLKVYREQRDMMGMFPDDEGMTLEESEEYYNAYAEILNKEEYQHSLQILRTLVDVNDVESIYMCVFDLENRKAIFVLDGSDPETTGQTPLGYVDDIDAENIEGLINKTNNFKAYVSHSEFGWLSTATQSVYNDNGDLVYNMYADIDMNKVMADRLNYLNHLALILLLITAVIIILSMFLVNRTIVIPIRKLSRAANNYSEITEQSNETVFDKIEIKTGDEIEKLRDSFVHMEREIRDYIDSITTITAEREKISAELNVAASIQAGYLPTEMPAFPDRSEFELFASMTPAKEVGGDFYDYYLIDDDHLAITVADVSGKGVPAAMFMMESMTLLKNQARQGGSLSPADILYAVNNQLCERNDAEMFVTAWLGILTISTGHMVCASAGHEYPVIKRNGGEFELFKDRHGFVLAGMEGSKYHDYELDFAPGDIIFSYTDGVPEATNAENELFGTSRLEDALNSNPEATTGALLDLVSQSIDDFVREAPQFDDITMVVMKYTGNSN